MPLDHVKFELADARPELRCFDFADVGLNAEPCQCACIGEDETFLGVRRDEEFDFKRSSGFRRYQLAPFQPVAGIAHQSECLAEDFAARRLISGGWQSPGAIEQLGQYGVGVRGEETALEFGCRTFER